MSEAAELIGMMDPLSDEELDELDAFLLSEACSDETMQIDMLDGYLTAIAIGPTGLRLNDWLPGVWGPTPDHAPAFASIEEAQRIVGYILRHMNDIIFSLEDDADAFEPLMMVARHGRERREHLDGEGWAYGFMQGVELARADWQPAFDDPQAAQALRPIHLLGGEGDTPEERRLTRTPEQRAALSGQIAVGVAALYRYWLPHRKAVHQRMLAATYQRAQPKVGRNDPCPCGSGKKFKKCCAAAQDLH